MGHVTLYIRQNENMRSYILSNAKHINEAWLSEGSDNNSSEIIKRFHCSKFENCFYELRKFVNQLGVVTGLSGNGIKDRHLSRLNSMLIASDIILPINQPEPTHQRFWGLDLT